MCARIFRLMILLGAVYAGVRPADAATEVKVIHPERGEVIRYITLPANIHPNQQVVLHAKVAGYLKSISVDKGDLVKTGQTLAEIEAPELVSLAAKQRAELHLAEINQERIETARSKSADLITGQMVDQAAGQLAVAKANLDGTEMLLRYANIVAPFDGVVTMRYVDPGAFVPAATAGASPASAAIVTVVDVSTLRIQTGVPESEAALVRVGQPVIFSVEEVAGKTFQSSVARTSGALDDVTRTLLVEADVKDASHTLMPGMYAMMKIGVEKHADVLWIPTEGLLLEKTVASAFVVVDGKAVKTPITIGFNDGKRVEVVKGLKAEDAVVLLGKLTLTPGQAVTVANAP